MNIFALKQLCFTVISESCAGLGNQVREADYMKAGPVLRCLYFCVLLQKQNMSTSNDSSVMSGINALSAAQLLACWGVFS